MPGKKLGKKLGFWKIENTTISFWNFLNYSCAKFLFQSLWSSEKIWTYRNLDPSTLTLNRFGSHQNISHELRLSKNLLMNLKIRMGCCVVALKSWLSIALGLKIKKNTICFNFFFNYLKLRFFFGLIDLFSIKNKIVGTYYDPKASKSFLNKKNL